MRLTIVHLYPSDMNLYGDRGNVLALARRAEWRGWEVRVLGVEPEAPMSWAEADIVFLGGGEDRHQALIVGDLVTRGADLSAALADGLPLLSVCGGFQLLGREYQTQDGRVLPGLGWFDATTRAGTRARHVGNVIATATLPLEPATLVGFENHAGETVLHADQRPLARVIVGAGNNGRDRTEGAVRIHAVGTYLHGSLLPKNPHLADWLLSRALERRTGEAELPPLLDDWEWAAHRERLAHPRA